MGAGLMNNKPEVNWSERWRYITKCCGAANHYTCPVVFKASWIGTEDKPTQIKFHMSGEHNTHA
jgi:hypothetical protein